AEQVDVIITTALIPGRPAPKLLPRDVVDRLRPGSIVVDLAAEQGGNCELTQPGGVVEHQGVQILGFTDMTSRMAPCASQFFATNVVSLLGEVVKDGALHLDLDNDVVRPALLLHQGEALPPPPRPAAPAPAPAKAASPSRRPPPPADAKPLQKNIMRSNRGLWLSNRLFGLVVIAA